MPSSEKEAGNLILAINRNTKVAIANVFMCHFENIWLENCPSHFKPIVYRWFADDGLFWHFYHFDQRITLQNLEVISMNNIKHKICIRNL